MTCLALHAQESAPAPVKEASWVTGVAATPGPRPEAAEALTASPAKPLRTYGANLDFWNLHFQSTYLWQGKRAFQAHYTGENSLLPQAETGYTLTATVFLGLRLWPGAEVYYNPEMVQSQEISELHGLGGITNGENQKSSGPEAKVYRARLFLRQTWGLGGEKSTVEDGPNQLSGTVESRRLVLTVGNLAVVDIFDNNAFSHDARIQFANWALITYGTYDYAADARGYTWGAALEYDFDEWAFRYGRFAQPRESNGLYLDNKILQRFGDQVELEHGHTLFGQPGKLRLLAFRNVISQGSFKEAVDYAKLNGGLPDVANVRREQPKNGFGVALEQNLTQDLGGFARLGWNDGRTETFTYAEIERSLSAGLVAKGRLWNRVGDSAGLALVQNGLSANHQAYLAAGGLGVFLGDGRLNYRSERIIEANYSLMGAKGIWLSVLAQRVWNPGYNADRGPVRFFGFRMHFEF